MKGVSKVIDSKNGKIYCFFNGSYKIIREYENLVELFEDETNIYCNLITSGFSIKKRRLFLRDDSKFILEVDLKYR